MGGECRLCILHAELPFVISHVGTHNLVYGEDGGHQESRMVLDPMSRHLVGQGKDTWI